MNLKNKIHLLLLTLVVLFFTTCKKYKYPESTYKWGDPAKPENCPFHGKITAYTVNGIDSLDLLDKYFDTILQKKYNVKLSIKQAVFECHTESAHEYQLDLVILNNGTFVDPYKYIFSKDRKRIKIRSIPSNLSEIFHKTLFITNETEWEVVRLSKDDKPFKLKTTLTNGNTYEIQIR